MRFFVLLTFILVSMNFAQSSQAQSFRGLDKSPLDYAYFPDNFAHDRREGDKAIIRVLYSRPQKKGREVFGKMVRYGKVWRTGANEATEIKLYQAIEFDGERLEAGTYSLFTLPNKDEWEIIFNRNLDYWGAYSYDESHDVLRVKVPVEQVNDEIEAFSIRFTENGDGKGIMKLGWDKTLVELPFAY